MTVIVEKQTRTVCEVLSGSLIRRTVLIRRNGEACSYSQDKLSASLLDAIVEFDALYNCWVGRFPRGRAFQQIMVFEAAKE